MYGMLADIVGATNYLSKYLKVPVNSIELNYSGVEFAMPMIDVALKHSAVECALAAHKESNLLTHIDKTQNSIISGITKFIFRK